MDLNLSLGYQEQNDNKALILTDTTDNYGKHNVANLEEGDVMVDGILYEILTQANFDFTTVGAGVNTVGTRFVSNGVTVTSILEAGDELRIATPTVLELTAITLDTVFTGTSNTPVTKNQIDILAVFGPFTVQDSMIYTVTSVHLDGDTEAALLEDGLYEVTYNVTYKGAGGLASQTETLVTTLLVYGQVQTLVYDKIRQIPAWCNCSNKDSVEKILEADLCGAYLTGIEQSAYIAKTEELITMLIVLDDMVKNGSNLYY